MGVTSPDGGDSRMTKYERQALEAIQDWKNREPNLMERFIGFVTWPVEKAGEYVLDMHVIGPVIQKAVGGLVNIANDVAQWSVRPEAIYSKYRKIGHKSIHSASDITKLSLEDVDRTIGYLATKYKGLATAEGATAGFVGLPGIAPDIAALVLLNLRAIGEYATYCGFDMTTQHERLYALHVLGLASSPSDASKTLVMAELIKIAQDVARKKVWRDLEKYVSVQLIQRITKALGIRLTKAKLAQIVPATGAIVGGGFNASFTAKVCDAAYYLYRERFLAEKYGSEVIVDVSISDGTAYPEADEDWVEPDDSEMGAESNLSDIDGEADWKLWTLKFTCFVCLCLMMAEAFLWR